MKLSIEFTSNQKGFELKQNLDCEIENDAEGLGYITNILFHSANTLATLMRESNPKYHSRLALGVDKSEAERIAENSPNYPFTHFLRINEKS